MIKSVYYSCHHARYDWASNEKQWCVSITAVSDDRRDTLSEIFETDPSIDGFAPSDVVTTIETRINEFFIHTGRDEKRRVIAWFRKHAFEIDRIWATQELAAVEKRVKHFKRLIEDLEEAEAERLAAAEAVA